jgi:MCM P-loop domain
MNFQRLVGLLKKSHENGPFEDIIGYEHIKRLFMMALDSESRTHILLVGPPASAKTMFLTSLLQFLKNAYFVDGGNTTKAGMIDYLFENQPRYLLFVEIGSLSNLKMKFSDRAFSMSPTRLCSTFILTVMLGRVVRRFTF